MLSSRSQNIVSSTSTENTFLPASTRHLAFKTPARSLKHGRAAHDENTIYGHPRTAGLTGKKKNAVLFSTPAINGPLKSRLKVEKVPRSASTSTALVEITNQTPFPTAYPPITPAPASLKPSTSFAIFNDGPIAPVGPRISSTRKKSRLPRSVSKSFETPDTNGNHWDVSDLSIEASLIEEASITEEDYDDVEYGPPTAIESKYDPGFDIPNYKEVGVALMSLFRQATIQDDYDPTADFDDDELSNEIWPLVWEKLELPDISSDNIFPFLENLEGTQEPTKNTQLPNATWSTAATSFAEPRSGPETKPKASTRIPIATASDTASKAINAKSLAKPPASRPAGVFHTRIPSLSRPVVSRAHIPVTQAAKPTLHSRTISMTHTRTTSVPKTTSVTHSRAKSMSSRAISGSKPIAKPISTNKRDVGTKLLRSEVLNDTLPFFTYGSVNEMLGEELLFEI